jgi:hypothetical protein
MTVLQVFEPVSCDGRLISLILRHFTQVVAFVHSLDLGFFSCESCNCILYGEHVMSWADPVQDLVTVSCSCSRHGADVGLPYDSYCCCRMCITQRPWLGLCMMW